MPCHGCRVSLEGDRREYLHDVGLPALSRKDSREGRRRMDESPRTPREHPRLIVRRFRYRRRYRRKERLRHSRVREAALNHFLKPSASMTALAMPDDRNVSATFCLQSVAVISISGSTPFPSIGSLSSRSVRLCTKSTEYLSPSCICVVIGNVFSTVPHPRVFVPTTVAICMRLKIVVVSSAVDCVIASVSIAISLKSLSDSIFATAGVRSTCISP